MNTPTPETDAVWEKGENILDHARKLERERDAWIAFADYMQTNGELRTANLYEAHELRRFAEESKGSR